MTQQPIFNLPQYKARRQGLRNNSTTSEQILWHALRGRQLGVKFRRQHGIGHYIVDFYCPDCALVVEVDGDSHYTDDGQAYDRVRDMYLCGLGLRVLRFSNVEVCQNLAGVCVRIRDVIMQDQATPP